MGTRSMIGILNESGTITASYCHYDGYLDGVGKTLIESYNNGEKAAEVARGGYLSSLGADYDESKGFSVNEDVAELFTNEVDFKENAEDFCGAEFIYLWDGTEWLFQEVYGAYKNEGFDSLLNNLKAVA
jgi:hypothetical protein